MVMSSIPGAATPAPSAPGIAGDPAHRAFAPDLRVRDNRLATLLNHGAERAVLDLTALDWTFALSPEGAVIGEEAAAPGYDDAGWEHVTLPHTWNLEDTTDGVLGDMRRTVGWYRTTLTLGPGALDGKTAYLEFLGVGMMTSVYVNGVRRPIATPAAHGGAEVPTGDPGTHLGGYAAFRVEAGSLLHEGANVIAVRADNRFDDRVIPLFADFDFYGGIYREAYLVVADDLHVDLDDYGASGLAVTTPNAGRVESDARPGHLGRTVARATLVNSADAGAPRRITVVVEVADAEGAVVARATRDAEVPAGGAAPVEVEVEVTDPHLWQPIDFSRGADRSDVGYQYTVTMRLTDPATGAAVDSVVERVGYRWFRVDKERGFLINGREHPLRGITRHQEREGLGNCLRNTDHLTDIRLILDLGANFIRLSHYPHANYFYDLCDANGIVTWSEIPFVDWVGEAERFADVTEMQLVEMIRQQGNRPSVCFWGLQNEVGNRASSNSWTTMRELMGRLDARAHAEDPTRLTTQATNQFAADTAYETWPSDLVAWNIYPGWYVEPGFGPMMDERRAAEDRPLGVSEYGAGGSIHQHALRPTPEEVRPNGPWHPEEYQCANHEEALAYINANPWLWCSAAWTMFDFSVDHRPSEAGRFELNDKGFVTHDRRVRKDVFYLYKANWNHADPFVHLCSKRYRVRSEGPTDIRLYSNMDRVWVRISRDGTPQVELPAEPLGDGVFTVPGQMAEPGTYTVWAYGEAEAGFGVEPGAAAGSGTGFPERVLVTDSVIWTRLADGDTSRDGRPAARERTGEPARIVLNEGHGFTIDVPRRQMISDKPLDQVSPADWEAAFHVEGDGRLDFHCILPVNLVPTDYAMFTNELGVGTRFDVIGADMLGH